MKRLLFFGLLCFSASLLEGSPLKKLKLDYDFFADLKMFDNSVQELANLYPGMVAGLFSIATTPSMYPKPLIGYLFYRFNKWLGGANQIKTSDLDSFFTSYSITHTKEVPADTSLAKRAVDLLVTDQILDWLYYAPAPQPTVNKIPYLKGKINVNADLQLVARYILTNDMKDDKGTKFANKWIDSSYEPLATSTKDELLACAQEALAANKPKNNDLAKGTLFGVLGIDLAAQVKPEQKPPVVAKKLLTTKSKKTGKKKKTHKKKLVDEILAEINKDTTGISGMHEPKAEVGKHMLKTVIPVVGTKETPPPSGKSVLSQSAWTTMGEQALKKIKEMKEKKKQEEEKKSTETLQPMPPDQPRVVTETSESKELSLSSIPPVTPITVTPITSEIIKETSTPASITAPITTPVTKFVDTPPIELEPDVIIPNEPANEPLKEKEVMKEEVISALQPLAEALAELANPSEGKAL